MSLDGSFSCERALQRLLARCPALRPDPRLASLAQKGAALAAEDAAAGLADAFLHPSYTIPVVGCFRPLASKLIDRAVAKLRMVPSLESEEDEYGEEIGEDDVYVVDFYVGRGRGLRLHELASLAFARAVDLVPFLLSNVLSYFRFSPPPFRRFLSIRSLSQSKEKVICHLLAAICVTYRLLYMEPKVFSELWNWSCFLDIVDNSSNHGLGDAMTSWDNILDIRWCGIQILSVVLKMSDGLTKAFSLGADEALMCLLRWEEFCQDTALEKAGYYMQHTDIGSQNHHDEICDFGYYVESTGNVTTNVELERRNCKNKVSCDIKLMGCPFILTSAVKKSFEMVLLAVSQRWPVLIYGTAGAGKTALINKLAHINQNQVIFIHMDGQMDSKMLIGSYVCMEQPGDFRWQPGTLTQAILNGYWVVFEDIDKAPSEVHSIILPLLEGSSSFATGHGEAVEVAERFRLFATVSTSKHDLSHAIEGSVLWRKVMLGTASKGDLLDIVNAWYPSLETFSSRLIDTFERVNSLSSYQIGGIQVSGISSAGVYNRFTLRDLLKWCRRVADLCLVYTGLALSASDCKRIYQEAIDIFASSSSSLESRLSTMRMIATIWGIPLSDATNLHPPHKPIVQVLRSDLQVGRITLQRSQTANSQQRRPFVSIRTSLHILERIACSVKYNEPVLLVGETGTGKTTVVQNLAMWLGQSITVVNLSQQSDIADLLGGFKPTDARSICIPLYSEFRELFCRTFSGKDNEGWLHHCEMYVMERKWKKLLNACQKSVDFAQEQSRKMSEHGHGSKRKRPLSKGILCNWESFALRLDTARKQIAASAGMSFTFVEGAFITALKKGQWILLDEVNLAPPEMLQRIVSVLDGDMGKLCLAERGDVDCIEPHSHFRIFACMNPATDAGKRELPYSFRSRFTEYFVDDVLDDEDLTLFISQYLDEMNTNREIVSRIVQFYKAAKRESEERLQDGANQKPQFSLRSLARALEYTKKAEATFGLRKALYDGFCMFFVTLLDTTSAKIMNNMIVSSLLGGSMPPNILFDGYFIEKSEVRDVGDLDSFMDKYVLTRSVKEHLKNLARAVYVKRYPVLLQGPTSSGKTSLVRYLASVTGHEFVRINNHEHTDLQEYLGSYITDFHGRLNFQEGILVKAVRKGHWIVLDELNLAPSDVLEALNRLLDDNRELFVPELQETVSAHPDFMLFATQNPPMLYGGRKILSRAFRNRFLEIHVDEIPEEELTTILEKRCMIPVTYAMKMVEVMKDLQLHRQNSKVFAGKHGFITPRDLFRWANRFRMFGKSYDDLAKDGYLVLAERLREENEKNVVKETLERRLRVKLIMDDLYKMESGCNGIDYDLPNIPGVLENLGNIMWTKSMWRLYFLVERCYKMREPVLLVGETGGGKTTVCQVLSLILGSRLHILNCHQYTETSDFLGGFHPVRDRSRLTMEFKHQIELLKSSKIFLHFSGYIALSSDITQASITINQLSEIITSYKKDVAFHPDITQQDLDDFEQVKRNMMQLQQKWQTIFLWQDGPLVEAMKHGDLFLVDEISLADDSVLERLNSVLEPERKLSLAEKGGSVLEKITAHPKFFLLATMNPSGDYGKKELSPALRNRFTEIWVPPVSDIDELRSIAVGRFRNLETSQFTECMLNFWQWFNQMETGRLLTVRDLLSWISFINVMEGTLKPESAFVHGAFLVLLDGLSLGTGISKSDANRLRDCALSFLLEEVKAIPSTAVDSCLSKMEYYGWGDAATSLDILCCRSIHSEHLFGINPFYIAKGHNACKREGFEFLAPTTSRNALRVLRAMQLRRPVLLEGSPGVGKTSLVVALAQYSGNTVVRINLSEQTDMMDLLGSDLPVVGENGMEFSWSDGILLQALRNGSWVLLDELNLAPQAVLEGLNAILDHRAEVYIPELGLTFKCPPSFRVFACQNPSSQGCGRKGLPKSFLNRFTKVYVDELVADDYLYICQSLYPSIPKSLLSRLILFNNRLFEDTMILRKYGQEGSPWEFNLRDIIRSCQIIEGAPENAKAGSFLSVVYLQRMRTMADRKEVVMLYEAVFGVKPSINLCPDVHINTQYLIVGDAVVQRNHFQPMKVLTSQLSVLPGIRYSMEAVLHCIEHNWLCILVGPYSSGKTSLIRLLAQTTGNALNELNLSSGTDVSELLGCFEQYNFFRTCKAVIADVERYVDEFCSLQLESSWKNLISERKHLITKWFSFVAAKTLSSSMSTYAFAESWKGDYCSSLGHLIEIIEQLKHDLEKYHLPVSWSHNDLNRSLKSLLELQKHKTVQPSAKFEWVSGDLIKAIECGEWVVLENANLCNPTVLDRINSLVEPDRRILINECGLVEGKPFVLHAHPKFRIFLTVDPTYGEVSRAMRNRGVEIFMMQPILPLDSSISGYEESELNDVKTFLISSGVPLKKLVQAMSEAHIFTKGAGLRFGVRITLLELTRWVQLFQQLLMSGNEPTWSLQLSYEHTYLSSLGELEGRDVIMQAKVSYLSRTELYKLDPMLGYSLSLPGGWPAPNPLKKLLWYSKEACIRRNCLYLEFLGAQHASYELSISNHGTFPFNGSVKFRPSIMPMYMIQQLLFLENFDQQNFRSSPVSDFDVAQANQMLFIAANWTFEQATEDDLALYIKWFEWYSSQLYPYCSFFRSFLNILEQERDHPIWKCILECLSEIHSHHKLQADGRPLPILSSELVELADLDICWKNCANRLENAIHCLGLLRLTWQQETAETNYVCSKQSFQMQALRVLDSLRCLEKKVLNVIVDLPQKMSMIYSNLLEHHIWFWKGLVSSHFECMLVAWNGLKKEALNLRPMFPGAVDALMEESVTLSSVTTLNYHAEKPMLWVHGGHPFLPSSAAVYDKMQQLLLLISAIWPRKIKKFCGENGFLIPDIILSAGVELRLLAMQGACMSSYIITKVDQHDADILLHLEELYQRLLRRLEHERRNIGCRTKTNAPLAGTSASNCCNFSAEILCKQSGFGSWVLTLPLFDKKSLSLDIALLQVLSKCTLVDASEVFEILCDTSGLLQHAMDYSLSFSSRSPIDLSPHQMILWILDAWNSVHSAHVIFASFVLEMWFNWHSSLWSYCSESNEKVHQSGYGEPSHLVQLTRATILDKILQSTFPIKDYDMQCLKLRVASKSLWQDVSSCSDLIGLLYSLADSLFRQIIFAHKKSFGKGVFEKIKSILSQLVEDGFTVEKFRVLSSLISSSRHGGLTSLMDLIIKPLLKDLYDKSLSYELPYKIGRVWLHIGVLRFYLLLNLNGPDPAIKYGLKHSWLLEKISLLELEMKVRRECKHFAGRNLTKDDEKKRVSSLQKLERDQRQLYRKVVFRPEPPKYKNLNSTCADFLEFVTSSMELVKNLKCDADLPAMIRMASNWQVTSATFINRLSEEYVEYVDIIQPIQIAIYEMKFGLSIAVSSAVQGEYLSKVEEGNFEGIVATIQSLMQFPRPFVAVNKQVELDGLVPTPVPCDQDMSKSIQIVDISLLEKLVRISNEISPDQAVSIIWVQATIQYILLIHEAHHVSSSRFMDKTSFMCLNGIFDVFARLWMDMKSQMKVKDDVDAQYYKFRPRVIKIEDILEGDLSLLSISDSDGNMMHEEKLVEQELTQMVSQEQCAIQEEDIKEEWDQIPDSILNSMILVHNQLFGSSDLVEQPGVCHISNKDRLCSFLGSYKLGSRILKDLFHMSPYSNIDDKLVPEHLLRLCLEYEKTLGFPCQSTQAYNFYKDSNASIIFEMVKPLMAIQEQVRYFLNEWPDHPGLQRILDISEMLFAIPPSAPLSKALVGLQLLVSRIQLLQEGVSRFSFSDLLQPICTLVSTWQKLELECWPALLDGVQEQYEINAGKLWFPLHAVLHRNLSGDSETDNTSTIQSIEEFIQTASVGEFKSRLRLLLAFHGQIRHGICLKAYTSHHMRENLNVLYNAFGYYMQFMPIVLDHIEAGRKCIEKDLKEQLKLFHWEHPHNYLSIENFKKTRHKMWKLIHKFNDILQQPVMIILNQEAVLKKDKVQIWLEQKISDEMSVEMSQLPLDLLQLDNRERFLWYADWRSNANSYLKSMCNGSTPDIDFLHGKDLIRKAIFSESSFLDFNTKWEEGWSCLDRICRSTIEFTHLWKYGNKSLKKRRALSELLKILERSGLSRHRSITSELEHKDQQKSLFLQPSFDVLHLLQHEVFQAMKDGNANLPSDSEKLVNGNNAWKAANKYYFRNLAVMQQIHRIFLNFSKDLSLEQVNRAVSFLDHLVAIQQEQRVAAYSASEQLRKLRQNFELLSSISSDSQKSKECCQASVQHFITDAMSGVSSVSPKQHVVLRCMWSQKHLFDSLLAMSKDICLLLKKAKNCHLHACDVIKVEADKIHALIDKFMPMFVKSKESLNMYLLGSDETVTAASVRFIPFIVSKQMEQLVVLNFQIINSFEEDIHKLDMRNMSMASAKGPLLNRFENLINMGKMMMEHWALEADGSVCEKDSSFMETFTKFSTTFSGTFEEIHNLVMDAFRNLGIFFAGQNFHGDYSAENITSWKFLLQSFMVNLHMDQLCDSLSKMIIAASNLANCAAGRRPEVHCQLEMRLNHLHVLLNFLLVFGEGILSEFLDVHRTISEMTNMLAHMFALLFSKGFGSVEEQTETTACDGSQDASGTGMGEGEGIHDVSEQIDDEDQLLGAFEKQEVMDNSNKLPSDKDRGIEMDEDFTGETFSISEDSGDDNSEDGEDINLESKMGEAADDHQVVDEKPWNEDEDGHPDNSVEKYESGPSVKETNSSSHELRAKEDGTMREESGDFDNDGPDKLNEEEVKPNTPSDDEEIDDMKLDKNNAFEDPTSIQFSEQEKNFEDRHMDEADGSDMTEAVDSGPNESDEETQEENENLCPGDRIDENSQIDEHTDTKEEEENAEDADMDLVDSSKDIMQSDEVENFDALKQGVDACMQMNYPHIVDSNTELDVSWSNSKYMNNELSPSRSLPSHDVPKAELTLPDSRNGSRLASDQPKPLPSESSDPSVPKTHPNPYRSIGDAMEDWKERVKISSDSEETQSEAPGDIEDEKADEYRYVSEAEKGTSQAHGPATSDQMKHNNKSNKSDTDESHIAKKEDDNKMDIVRESSETLHLKTSRTSPSKQSSKELLEMVLEDDAPAEETRGNSPSSRTGDVVSFRSSYMNERALPSDTLDNDNVISKDMDIEELSNDMKQRAIADWKKYELRTAKLSQELAEQLRLIMEPTLASKLQGDYRTGKRINMKKVIPYIASHFQKDKIWLRRTRPNKRDYQVVVAIDDSRSMSESHCGNVAVEALVTVCRSMSQLEVGQLAVASFGEKGNIKVLHDFDQPFTSDAGVKMISSLSFKQDNTIADEPVVNLLKYLNNILDAAVATARMPSGQNPLNQLILIIADGRFHEKENLKRRVRDVLNRRRMIAFILLDSPQESIMDLMEASFEGEKLSFMKYLDSFPFPYYIVLKNIEALPRTLADLLRQWFELMQSIRE